ncbi:hypothetical protein TNCT_350761 [Trichonephila clavata]|uniref:Uncharacterized protein n=1 Tax=Trichonephila clavata TaxID=2740835 RepID=A0A8X6G7I4_TRICU|nr:hypothetical protein TNCT_350761 [Trichonephila clavata]
MGKLENVPAFYPQIPCPIAGTKIKPPFLPGILPGRHVNASKEDPCQYIAGNFRPCKRAFSSKYEFGRGGQLNQLSNEFQSNAPVTKTLSTSIAFTVVHLNNKQKKNRE